MLVTEFLQGRHVNRQSVTRYIQRHAAEFKGHTRMKGKELDLDEFAVQLLNEQYPMILNVVEDNYRDKYETAIEKLAAAYEQLSEAQKVVAEAVEFRITTEQKMLVLEDKANKVETLEEQLKAAERERDQAKAEVTELRRRKLIDRIFNR